MDRGTVHHQDDKEIKSIFGLLIFQSCKFQTNQIDTWPMFTPIMHFSKLRMAIFRFFKFAFEFFEIKVIIKKNEKIKIIIIIIIIIKIIIIMLKSKYK